MGNNVVSDVSVVRLCLNEIGRFDAEFSPYLLSSTAAFVKLFCVTLCS